MTPSITVIENYRVDLLELFYPKNKGVARGGRWGSSPTLACHCPTLGGQRGQLPHPGMAVKTQN